MRGTRNSRAGGLTMPVTSRADYAYLRQLVLGLSQNVLDPAHDYLFETRLSALLRSHGMTKLHELVQLLRARKNPILERVIAEAMITHETSFFRDSRPFDLLRTELLPRLIEQRRPARALRLWSAACSTGQEAYSLAIGLREHFPHLAHWNIRIDGTDLCAEAVRRAQAGRYHRLEINRGLPARLAVRYFDRLDEDWVVKPEVRSLCTDDDELAGILGEFVAGLPEQVEAMRRALHAREYADLQRFAHRLKGAGGSYGYPMLTDAAKVLEEAAGAGDFAAASRSLDTVARLSRAITDGYHNSGTRPAGNGLGAVAAAADGPAANGLDALPTSIA